MCRGDTILRGGQVQRVRSVEATGDEVRLTMSDGSVQDFLGDESITVTGHRAPLVIATDASTADGYRTSRLIIDPDGREWSAVVIDGHDHRPPRWWVVRGTDPVRS